MKYQLFRGGVFSVSQSFRTTMTFLRGRMGECVVACLLMLLAPTATRAQEPDAARMSRGFEAFSAACLACHGADQSAKARVAPPMEAIKRRYLRGVQEYSTFRDAMALFLRDSDPTNARMPGAVRRFGAMPQLSLDDASIGDITYYVYHAELDRPDWFEAHHARGHDGAAPRKQVDFLRHGRNLAMRTKSELGGELKRALAADGPAGAVSFCSLRAVPIVERLSERLGAKIRRVSDRPRNPDNQANATERRYMEDVRAALAAGEEPRASVHEQDGAMVGYYPIMTNAMCLQCHGRPGKDISADTLARINARYPMDKAVDYGASELRGLFVVLMPMISGDTPTPGTDASFNHPASGADGER